jgi:cytochrome c556
MKKRYIGWASGILGLGLLTMVHAAGPKPEEAVEYRQSVYTVIKWHFSPIGAMIKGEIPFDAAAVSRHAQYVEMMSAAALDGFPAGSGPDAVQDTDAKANIWTNWDQFESAMAEFHKEAVQLAEIAKGGDAGTLRAQFVKTAETCKSCHREFRAD